MLPATILKTNVVYTCYWYISLDYTWCEQAQQYNIFLNNLKCTSDFSTDRLNHAKIPIKHVSQWVLKQLIVEILF